jgi:hypothetical protein
MRILVVIALLLVSPAVRSDIVTIGGLYELTSGVA